ncbi:amidohydrolase family protein [Shimia thalassica]|uniref:amidohydrolase family protein n=1 Tax=Shimia thalassica TaxID=1715693 RepID=UPI0020906C4A|nr:amidohydrolase family protein [Shimia thalassica]MDO6482999.1 amidohydrolase family protein [Shimia thalassica]MDO6503046.1 amidohydrolase family protein [Shimia thalassica]MDO6522346.1 amidohydrolase family protein [Shimia thalassica]MDO6798267.1 amidohydrolase family protein [Shimia thalassica]MDP2579597.1 amidohydrolase family protein [Shimia thalassica]
MPAFANSVCAAVLAAAAMSSLAMADDAATPIGDAVKDLPIFDAHIHYKEPAWDAYPVKSIIQLMDRNGVAMGLVSSTPDEGTIMLWEYAPNRIVPELRPYHGNAGSSNWAKVEGMQEYLRGRLDTYPHEGIGEFHIHRLDPFDEPLFRDVIKLAKERDIYLHVHSGADEIRWLYGLDPSAKIIWAHAGLGESANGVYRLMKERPTLLADTSLKEYEILDGQDSLHPVWKKIIYQFQDRLMVGSDTWVNSQWDDYDSIIASNRAWLSLLPRDVAEKIAYKNAERVFDRDISMDLIGKR